MEQVRYLNKLRLRSGHVSPPLGIFSLSYSSRHQTIWPSPAFGGAFFIRALHLGELPDMGTAVRKSHSHWYKKAVRPFVDEPGVLLDALGHRDGVARFDGFVVRD